MGEASKSVFPGALDMRGAGGTLLEAPNATPSFIPAARLAVGIGPNDLTIKVVGIDLFRVPDQGLLTINEELIRYTSKNVALNELYVDNVDLRGYANTAASAYTVGTQVLWMLTNEHLASIHAAIEATQKHIGIAGSTDPDSIEYRLRALAERYGDGDMRQAVVEVTQEHLDQKFFTLSAQAKSPSGVVLFVVNGGTQENGTDYVVSSTNPCVVGWAGLSLDGLLSIGDKLLVLYEEA